MKTAGKKEKRTGIRIPLLSEEIKYHFSGNEKLAVVGDITADGVFLKTSEILPPRSEVTLQIQLPGDLGELKVQGKVVRVNWAVQRKKHKENLGFGVRFETLTEGTRKILDAYVVYLRNKQIISVSKKIIEEFFGSSNPKKLL
jgi:Tfp pilus assembly protein PilZ